MVTQGETDPEFFLSMGVLFLLLVGFLYISDLYLFSFSSYLLFCCVTLAQFNFQTFLELYSHYHLHHRRRHTYRCFYRSRSVTEAVLSDTKFTSKESWHTSLHLILPTIKEIRAGLKFFLSRYFFLFFIFYFLSFSCQILLSIDLYLSF